MILAPHVVPPASTFVPYRFCLAHFAGPDTTYSPNDL